MPKRLLVCALMLALAACASEPPRGRGGGGPRGAGFREGGGAPARVRLFISPSGEPFHGENGLAVWFAGADTDHGGSLSLAEFQADAMRFFKVLDANGDGVLDGFEIQAYERDRVPEIEQLSFDDGPRGGGGAPQGGGGRRGGGRGRGGGGSGGGGATPASAPMQAPGAGREGAARFGLLNEPQPVANADEDVNGRVTQEEWKHATQRRFDHLDRARTGRLILSDLILPRDARRPPGPPLNTPNMKGSIDEQQKKSSGQPPRAGGEPN